MSGAAVAVLVAKARRRIVTHFESVGALTPQAAIPFTPRDRRIDRRMFRRMREHGAIQEASAGRFYLDHDRLADLRASMRRRVLGVLALGGAAVAAIAALA